MYHCATKQEKSSSGTAQVLTSKSASEPRSPSGAVKRTWQKRRDLATQAVGPGVPTPTSGIGRRNATALWVLIHGMVCPEPKNSSSGFIPTINRRSGNLPRGPLITGWTKKSIIALCSSTSALVLKSGGKHPEICFRSRRFFILMTENVRRALIPITLAPVAPLSRWNCECAYVMELIAGSWFALTHCATKRDRLRVGMLPRQISKTASRRKTSFVTKTSLCAKKSTKPRCLKRSLEHLPL